MCRYCEEKVNESSDWSSFKGNNGHYIAFSHNKKEFNLCDMDDFFCSVIQYCPWCGRKLEVLENKRISEITITKDDFDLLLKRVGAEKQRLTELIALLAAEQRENLRGLPLSRNQREAYYKELLQLSQN